MSVATVVTRGYGTFGNVNFVTVRGYGSFGVAVVDYIVRARRKGRR